MKLDTNSVIQLDVLADGEPGLYRVLFVSRSEDLAVLLNMNNSRARPERRPLHSVEAALGDGNARLATFSLPAYMLVVDSNESDEAIRGKEEGSIKRAKARQDRNWKTIKPLVTGNDRFRLFDPEEYSIVVRCRAKEVGRSAATVSRLLYRYWKYGFVPNALLPAYANCGAPGKTRQAGKVKRGRPSKLQDSGHVEHAEGKNVTDTDKQFIELGAKLFVKGQKLRWSDAYDATLARFYIQGYEEINGAKSPILLPPDQRITLGQFRYWGPKLLDPIEILRARVGERQFALKHRGLHGKARDKVYGPGARFEIDSTIADVYLVSRYNRDWIIGRPVVYAVVDVFSGMFVGLHIGLEAPSRECAYLALLSSCSDKVELCRQNGLDIAEADWPCHHLPMTLFADRGELLGDASELTSSGLCLDVQIAPAFRGDLKPIVERSFRTLKDRAIYWLPGAVEARWREVKARDYRLDAKLDISEFTRIILLHVIEHNLYAEHSRDGFTKEMIADGVEPHPISVWNWGLENLTGYLIPPDRELARITLLPGKNATVTENGVLFRGLRYTGHRPVRENWYARARNYGSWSVSVKYHPHNPGEIYYWPNRSSTPETFVLQDPKGLYANKRMEEIIDMLEYQKMTKTQRIEQNRTKRVAIKAQAQNIVNKAVMEANRERTEMPKSDRTSDIRDKRNFEIQVERSRALAIQQEPKGAKVLYLAPKADDKAEERHARSVVDILKKQRDENLG